LIADRAERFRDPGRSACGIDNCADADRFSSLDEQAVSGAADFPHPDAALHSGPGILRGLCKHVVEACSIDVPAVPVWAEHKRPLRWLGGTPHARGLVRGHGPKHTKPFPQSELTQQRVHRRWQRLAEPERVISRLLEEHDSGAGAG
jgi:hypothetical protein